MPREVILAIETGISKGSLSILKDGSELDFWIGEKKIPSSEDLLSNIAKLFSKNNIDKLETKRIAVSIGPGSFTGVRVGIATALGLSKALKCECVGISVLEAIASQFTGVVVTAFEVGENEVCWQSFERNKPKQIRSLGQPKIDRIHDFSARLKNHPQKALILDRDLYRKFEEGWHSLNAGDFDLLKWIENPAKYVGLRSEEITLTSNLLPLYARDAGIS
jgi:tRNA threonylcarbamoyl adenosine modification protein YeaZ